MLISGVLPPSGSKTAARRSRHILLFHVFDRGKCRRASHGWLLLLTCLYVGCSFPLVARAWTRAVCIRRSCAAVHTLVSPTLRVVFAALGLSPDLSLHAALCPVTPETNKNNDGSRHGYCDNATITRRHGAASAVVETKGFVPTPATLDAEVQGEIVKEDGTPVASVAPSESKPKVCSYGLRLSTNHDHRTLALES